MYVVQTTVFDLRPCCTTRVMSSRHLPIAPLLTESASVLGALMDEEPVGCTACIEALCTALVPRRAAPLLQARRQSRHRHRVPALRRLADALHDRHALQRLLHEVVRATTHRFYGGLDGAVGRHQHHLGVGCHGVERLQQLEPAHARHHEVGHHHGHALLATDVERGTPAGGREHARPFALEDAPEALEVGRVVVDDE